MAMTMTMTAAEQAAACLARWRDDPVLFATEVLGVACWRKQRQILRTAAASQRVAVRSGHKIGKSTCAVVLAIWFVVTRPRARVILTSASGRQVKSILWKELRRLYRGSRVPLGGQPPHKVPDAGWQFADGREVIGFSTDDPEKMAGFSGPENFYIADEASGIAEEIFEAIEGNRAGGARLVMFSNPTRTSGYFFEAFHEKCEFWEPIHVSSEETPNASGVGTPIPGLATRDYIEEKKREWGEENPLYQVRVKGNFPSQGPNAIVGLTLLQEARARYAHLKPEGTLSFGVDVARFGDDETVIAPRRGDVILPLRVFGNLDTEQVTDEVVKVVRELRRPGEARPRVKVDEIGAGAGVVDGLRARYSDLLEVVGVNVATESNDKTKFPNLRSQLVFGVRDWLKEGGALPPDSKLAGEVVAPVYRFDAQGRQVVESKDDIKKRLKRSPDRFDAVALAVYEAPVTRVLPMPKRAGGYRLGGGAARGY